MILHRTRVLYCTGPFKKPATMACSHPCVDLIVVVIFLNRHHSVLVTALHTPGQPYDTGCMIQYCISVKDSAVLIQQKAEEFGTVQGTTFYEIVARFFLDGTLHFSVILSPFNPAIILDEVTLLTLLKISLGRTEMAGGQRQSCALCAHVCNEVGKVFTVLLYTTLACPGGVRCGLETLIRINQRSEAASGKPSHQLAIQIWPSVWPLRTSYSTSAQRLLNVCCSLRVLTALFHKSVQ